MNQPMSVFRVSVLAMICLSTLTLTISEGYIFPTSLTIPVAIFSYFYTDLKKKIVIDPTLAAVFGILAIGGTAAEFFSGIEQKILSSAHLVSYFTWIVLMQEKRLQNYWTLAALSLLQMAIAAVLTNHIFFGFMTIAYVLVSIWTLVVFSVYRAGLRVRTVSESQSRQNAQKEPAAEPVVNVAALSVKRDPMAYLNPGHSSSRGSIHLDSGRRWINSGLLLGVCVISGISIAIGTLFFAGTPRVWLNRMSYAGDLPGSPLLSSMTGFTDSVQLGQTGDIRDNITPAMRVRFTEIDAAVDIPEERQTPLHIPDLAVRWGYDLPLFRGNVLEYYSAGRWETVVNQRQSYAAPERPSSGRYIRQAFTVDMINTPRMFAMYPIVASDQTQAPTVYINYLNDTLIMRRRGMIEQVEYAVYAPVSTEGVEPRRDITPVTKEKYEHLVGTNYIQAVLQLPTEPDFLRLINLAKTWKAEAEKKRKRPLTDREIMMAFEQRLLNSPEFQYTLTQEVADTTIDPIVDFLFNRKKGHCEYYASALTLLLRSVDIPARMVGGFKGGQWNDEKQELVVLQKFAHTWVEALDEDQLEWLTLDPTPPIRNQELGANGEESEDRMFGFSDDFWKQYVIGMSFSRQKELFYEPVLDSLKSFYDSVINRGNFIEIVQSIVMEFIRHPERLFSWQGGLMVGSLGAFLVGLVWIGNRVVCYLSGRGLLKGKGSSRHHLMIEFYERFVKLMRTYKLQRETSQTHREFADVCQETLEPLLHNQPQLARLDELTEAYYSWRFGNHELPQDRIVDLMRSLDHLEQSLAMAQKEALQKVAVQGAKA